MPRIALAFASLALWTASAFAAEPPPYSFLAGAYECVGRHPDSNVAYSGRVEISLARQGVSITRTIAGHTVKGTGKYRTSAGGAQLFEIQFTDGRKTFQETCLVNSDLDNYARMTCYVYASDTRRAGLEALFSDHGQLKK